MSILEKNGEQGDNSDYDFKTMRVSSAKITTTNIIPGSFLNNKKNPRDNSPLRYLLESQTIESEGLFVDLDKEDNHLNIKSIFFEKNKKKNVYQYEEKNGGNGDKNNKSKLELDLKINDSYGGSMQKSNNVDPISITECNHCTIINNLRDRFNNNKLNSHEQSPHIFRNNIYQNIVLSYESQYHCQRQEKNHKMLISRSFSGENYDKSSSSNSQEISYAPSTTCPSQTTTSVNFSTMPILKEDFNMAVEINGTENRSNDDTIFSESISDSDTSRTQYSHLLNNFTIADNPTSFINESDKTNIQNLNYLYDMSKPSKILGNHELMFFKRKNNKAQLASIPICGEIRVTDPVFIGSSGIFRSGTYWSYSIIIHKTRSPEDKHNYIETVSNIRRRFRHFVALEQRIRNEFPGAILPPRPSKHPIRLLETSAHQSLQFAFQRSSELETYLNEIRLHPFAGKSNSLHFFLRFPGDLGTVWPEVSASIFTRLSEAGHNTVIKVSENTSSIMNELNSESQLAASEDNFDILTLSATEGLRMSNLMQAVPKIENAILIIRNYGEKNCFVGLENQKIVKSVPLNDSKLSLSFEVLSSGLIASGRRTMCLATELMVSLVPFFLQRKLCKYEHMAIDDMSAALTKRCDTRNHKDTLNNIKMGIREGENHAEIIGMVLQLEIGRISQIRKKDWSESLRVMLINLNDYCTEQIATWESCRDILDETFSVGKNITNFIIRNKKNHLQEDSK